MTTVIPFLPSTLATPTFDATLDGDVYEIRITWNVSAQRYYLNIYNKGNNNWVITIPLMSSPPARRAAGAVYDPFLNAMVVTLVDPSLWPVPLTGPMVKPGTIIEYTLEQFQPSTYNGTVRALHINDTTFTFPIDRDPGPLLVLGQISRMINMAAPIFTQSLLIYRNGAFEISP